MCETSKRKRYKDCAVEVEESIDTVSNDILEKENNSSKKKRMRYTIEDKMNILKESDNLSSSEICQRYGITQRALQKWKQNRNQINEFSQKPELKSSVTIRNTSSLDDALYTWLIDAQNKGIPVTGPIIRQKAQMLNKELGGRDTFKASSGWLDLWQKRKSVRFSTITGEKQSEDTNASEAYKSEFKKILETKQLTRAQVFNFDKTGLLIKEVPHRTLVSSDVRQACGTKEQLERITIGACCNADGSFKLPLVVVGKSKNPRCLPKDKSNLPVWYRNQTSAWVDKIIFSEWFSDEFVPKVLEFLKEKNLPLTAALIVERCRSHTFMKIGDIEILFLPANVTSLIQPLDQGIIQALKLKYQFYLVNSLLKAQEESVALIGYLKTVKLDRVIEWISEAWKYVESDTIYKGWKNLWPIEKKDASTQTIVENSTEIQNDLFEFPLLNNAVGFEIEDDNLQIPHRKIDNLLQLIKQIKGYEYVKKTDVLSWLRKELPEVQDTISDNEIVQQVTDNDDSTLNISKKGVCSNSQNEDTFSPKKYLKKTAVPSCNLSGSLPTRNTRARKKKMNYNVDEEWSPKKGVCRVQTPEEEPKLVSTKEEPVDQDEREQIDIEESFEVKTELIEPKLEVDEPVNDIPSFTFVKVEGVINDI